jgi:uncharacterized repeat protein (TIGR03843 family)
VALPLPSGEDRPELEETDALEILARGDIQVRGRILEASNATLLAQVELEGVRGLCVYKPTAGERPLWDFPGRSLANREAATYLLSSATGWGLVPPTTLRVDGPFGPGSVQWWILGQPRPAATEADDAEDVEELAVAEPGAGVVDVVPPNLRPPGWLDVVDAVANNADRKGGHILRAGDGRLYGVDHGLTFNEDEKLRTVLWGWAGKPLTPEAVDVLEQLAADLDDDGPLRRALLGLLDRREVQRTLHRVRRLLTSGRYPRPGGHRPSIPWPAF